MINVSWNPAARAISYKLTVKAVGEPDKTFTSNSASVQLNLPSTKSYEVTVSGVNTGGEGPASDPAFYVPQVPDQVTGVTVSA